MQYSVSPPFSRQALTPIFSYLVILVLQLCLCTLASTSNGLGVVSVEGAARLSMVQAGTVLVVPSNQKRHTKGPTHDRLTAISRLAETQGQVANGLGAALYPEGFGVVEGMGLALDAGVLNHAASIGLEAGHGAADVSVDLDDLLDGRGLQEGGCYALLDAENDTF